MKVGKVAALQMNSSGGADSSRTNLKVEQLMKDELTEPGGMTSPDALSNSESDSSSDSVLLPGNAEPGSSSSSSSSSSGSGTGSTTDRVPNILKCPECKKQFRNGPMLTRHLRKHLVGSAFRKCSYCQRQFKTKGLLKSHVEEHAGEKPLNLFNCSVCDRGFGKLSTLEIHMERMHLAAKEKTYHCDECGLTLKSLAEYGSHIEVHVKNMKFKPTFTCPDCKREFRTQCMLDCHMYTGHTGEKPYSCTYCDKKFLWNSGLSRHLEKEHSH